MALTPISSDSWSQEIADAAEEFMNAIIDVYLPGTPGKYNGTTDTRAAGTADTVLIADRKARIQHSRLPMETAGSAEWGAKRRYAFQIPLLDADPIIPKGAFIRVTDGGRDVKLEAHAYVVISAANSSHAALRTIETVTDAAVVP